MNVNVALGTPSFFSTVEGFVVAIWGFRYYLMLSLAMQRCYVHYVVWLSTLLQMAFVLIITFVAFVFVDCLIGMCYAVLYPYKYIIPVGVLVIGICAMSVLWAMRKKSFALIARTKLTQTFIACIIKIAGAYTDLRPLRFLLGFVAGRSCGGVKLIRHIIELKGTPRLSFSCIKRSTISYRNMCLVDTNRAFLSMASAYILPLIIAYYYADDIIGSFTMAQNLLILSEATIGQSIGQVFSQKAGEARYNGTLASVTAKAFELLARTGLYPVLLCSLFAPDIFEIALGSQWREAGLFASILGSWMAISFIYSPMSMLFTTLMIQRTALIFTSIYTFTRLGSVAIFGKSSPLYAMAALSTSGSFMMMIGVSLLMYKSGVNNIPSRICRIVVETLIELLPCIAFLLYEDNDIYAGVLSVLVSLSLYLFFNLRFYKEARSNKNAI